MLCVLPKQHTSVAASKKMRVSVRKKMCVAERKSMGMSTRTKRMYNTVIVDHLCWTQ
jgi:hypothetical protein